MANWTSPATWVDGEIPNAAKLNTQIRDNSQYLYDNKMAFAATISQPTRALGLGYTNTTGKLLHVIITVTNTSSARVTAISGGVTQGIVSRSDTVDAYLNIAFFVAPDATYSVTLTNSGTLYSWCETVIG